MNDSNAADGFGLKELEHTFASELQAPPPIVEPLDAGDVDEATSWNKPPMVAASHAKGEA